MLDLRQEKRPYDKMGWPIQPLFYGVVTAR
jgi:hypothetical protein